MLVSKEYVAIADFLLNLDNGKNSVNVKRGDHIMFDGMTAEVGDMKGQAHSLAKTIGEWIVLKGKSATKDTKAPMRSRNLTGGRILENSNPESEPELKDQQKKDDSTELQRLLDENEKPQKKVVSDDMRDLGRKPPTIIDEDASIVRTVTKTDSTGVKNTSGVELAEKNEGKRPVISAEERVAKETSYDGKKASTEPVQKRLPVEKEGQGVEVRKTGSVRVEKTKVSLRPEVSHEEDPVMETTYENNQHTDVGSTTQKDVATPKSTKKPVQKAAVTKTAAKVVRPAIEAQDQDARVVKKVSVDRKLELQGGIVEAAEDGSVSMGGIVSKVTVGAPSDMSVGDVEFSSNDTMDAGEVEFSSTEDTAVDASAEADANIDIDDIIGKA